MVDIQVGALIENRYRVLSAIGSGGMGTLYRVSDEAKSGQVVALKMLRATDTQAKTPGQAERFQCEFQILAQLRHPNLVSIYNYGVTTAGELYFTMEWIEGQNLNPDGRPLDHAEITPLVVQICRALAYLHARGVIHGDLKPSNVLLASSDDAPLKIVDFGLALEARSDETQAQYHTPGYSAPEVRQQRPLDQRADLYSLGALWYALLVGEPPTFAPGAGRLRQLALDEALQAQKSVPAQIGPVITRLLSDAPERRHASANGVIEAINQATGNHYALETRETAASYALRGRFVGRATELAALENLWERAQSGETGVVLVGGESGVGKTRLAEELGVQVELAGGRVARGQCVQSGSSLYRPWREVLRLLFRHVEGADGAGLELKRVGPVLTSLLPELWGRPYLTGAAPAPRLDPQATQHRLNNVVAQVLRTAARLRPTLIVIEDAHWADEATLALLGFLARVPTRAGLLVCVTYRDDGGDPAQMLNEMSSRWLERLRLDRLSPPATTDLVCSMLGLEGLPASLTQWVQQTTGGNAFFVQELIRSLAEDGVVLRRTLNGWQVDAVALQGAHLPQSIRQVIQQRLEHLSAESRQVLQCAAAVGTVFWDGIVKAISQLSKQRAQAALAEGLAKELILERDASAFEGQREYLFAGSVLQEASYANIPQETQQTYHERAAVWLMAHGDEETGQHLGLIASHLERAGQTEQAAIYLQRAGEQAAAQFANAEAIAYLSRALDLTPPDDQARRYTLLLARENVHQLQGAREAQAQDLTALQESAEALADDRRRAEVTLRQAERGEATGDYMTAIAAAQAALNLAQAVQDASMEARAHLVWGQALWRHGEMEAGRVQLERGLTLAQDHSLHEVEATCLRSLGHALWIQGDYTAAKTHCKRALHIQRRLNDPKAKGTTFNNLGLICSDLGDYTEARTYYEQARHLWNEIGYRRGEGWANNNLGWISDMQGDYASARAYLKQALRIHREIGDPAGECAGLTNLGLVCYHLGDDQAAREHNQQALHTAQSVGHRRWQGYALNNLGHALVSLGHLTEAADAYRQALALRRELGEHKLAMESLAGLARVSRAQGDLKQAQALAEEMLDYLETNTLNGVDEPFRVELTCYRVLRTNQDPRAQDILSTTHCQLQEQAAKIRDEEKRRLFLNIAVHREIMCEFIDQAKMHKNTQTAERPIGELDQMRQRIAELEAWVAAGRQALEAERRRCQELSQLIGDSQDQTRDRETQMQADEALWESEKRFRSVAETASDAIIIFDRHENIIFWNQAAKDVFRYPAGETMGKLLASIMTWEFQEMFQQEIEHIISSGESDLVGQVVEATGVRKDGHQFPLEISLATWQSKQETFFTLIARDVTERKQAQATLARQAQELARSNAELEQFAYLASHDLQEPLRKIKAFGDRLKARCAGGLDERGLDYLERMQSAAERMQNLINALLTFARVTSQAQPFAPVDLAQVVQEVLLDLEMRIEQVGGRVEVGDLPAIEADPVQMRQLLQNLIGNALKFRREDEASVVKVYARSLDNQIKNPFGATHSDELCQIMIQDNGIGFDEKYTDRIFQVFQRLHGRSEYEGTGIGLATCRKIVERHGGTITAESTPGQGATFFVTLPVKQCPGKNKG